MISRSRFTVNSGGQTEYDGAWEMEDMFDPQQGLRWTAKAAAGYTITQISSQEDVLREKEHGRTIPLRLQEARAALFDPMPDFGETSIRSGHRTATFTARK